MCCNDSLQPELFPTKLRASGHAVANCFARIGAFFSPFLAEKRSVPMLVIGLTLGIVNGVAAAAALFLPETAGRDLDVSEPV